MLNLTSSDKAMLFQKLRKERVARVVESWMADRNGSGYGGQFEDLLNAITRESVNYGLAADLSDSQFEYGPLQDACDVIVSIAYAVSDPGNMTIWRHRSDILRDIPRKLIPAIDRSGLETATGMYLNLPFRCDIVDRLLIDALIAMEFYAYGDEMFNERRFPGISPRSPLKQRHSLYVYLLVQSQNALTFLGIAAAAMFAASHSWIGWNWAFWIAGPSVVVFLILFALGTIYLPSNWLLLNRKRKTVLEIINSMNASYIELKTDGPISATRMKEVLKSAAEKGVSWPAPVFALLDDVNSRVGRF